MIQSHYDFFQENTFKRKENLNVRYSEAETTFYDNPI